MKWLNLLYVLTALLASAVLAEAASGGTHEKAKPVKGVPQAVDPHHDRGDKDSSDDDSSSHEKESELHEQMEVLGKNFKKLSRLFRSEEPDAAQALKYIAACKKAAIAVKDLVPETVEKMEEGKEKKEALEQYQEQIKKLIKTFTQLETALKENDTAKAKGLVNLLKKQKKEGHDKFIEEDE